jgi:hypothetical protein
MEVILDKLYPKEKSSNEKKRNSLKISKKYKKKK